MNKRDTRRLIVSVVKGDTKTLRSLLSKGHVDVNLTFEPGQYDSSDYDVSTEVVWTLLHQATYRGYESVARLLLKHGINPNIIANTESMRCTKWDDGGSWDLVSDGDDEYYSMNGQTPLDIASIHRDGKMTSLLSEYGAKHSAELSSTYADVVSGN